MHICSGINTIVITYLTFQIKECSFGQSELNSAAFSVKIFIP